MEVYSHKLVAVGRAVGSPYSKLLYRFNWAILEESHYMQSREEMREKYGQGGNGRVEEKKWLREDG